MGFFSDLFGGDSSSSSTSTTVNRTSEVTKSLADYSQLDSGAAQTKLSVDTGDSATVNLSALDGGAIAKSFDYATEALKQMGSADQRAKEVALQVIQSANPDTTVSQTMIKYGFVAAAIIATLILLSKNKGAF